MENLVGGPIGIIHLITSVLALIFGTTVLLMKKGTKTHKKMGYAYFVSMVVLLGTSFMLYRLFGGFGVFHYAALLSGLTLIFGMIPAWRKKPRAGWLIRHFSFMYWSVIGLYAAFASEVLTRIPETPFFGMVGIATGTIMILGAIFFRRYRKAWSTLFASK